MSNTNSLSKKEHEHQRDSGGYCTNPGCIQERELMIQIQDICENQTKE